MLERGETAPTFEAPVAHDGDVQRLSFEELVDGGIVLIVFYPADFSPKCTDELCSLRDLDLFSLQSDVSIIGISTDSAYSHRAFAAQNNLGFPLVSDTDGAIGEAYDVLEEEMLGGHRRLDRRSVFVLDNERTVHFAWSTDDPWQLPDLEAVRAAIEEVSDDNAAVERYRVADMHHREGLEAYERGHEAFAANDWVIAAGAFESAIDPLTDASDAFDAARRYADDEEMTRIAERAHEQATDRRNAARWFAAAADHYGRGEESSGDGYRSDAERIHATVVDTEALPTPDALLERDGVDISDG